MLPASTEVAGGFVTATLADNDNAQAVFGCKAVRQATGSVLIRTSTLIPVGKGRIWVELYATPLAIKSIAQLSPTDWLVLTYLLGTDAGPVLTQTPTNYGFAFGISALPD
jgi:hypothetical protein